MMKERDKGKRYWKKLQRENNNNNKKGRLRMREREERIEKTE